MKLIKISQEHHDLLASFASKERRTLQGQMGLIIDEWIDAQKKTHSSSRPAPSTTTSEFSQPTK